MDILLLTLIQAQGQQARPQGGGFMGFLPLIVLFFLFWVMIIVPQRRQAKAHLEMVQSLQKGDQVVTAGGLIGVVSGIREDQMEVRTGTSTVVVERSKISRRVVPTATANKA
ncbi:preprotein translocase subunit YajC [Longimicrobium sp.]|uniref:preprotein translocase subunit YajC n=1 Tax=Longimicrobium sp. TaxID=2029185 RepID=UPI003B3AE039